MGVVNNSLYYLVHPNQLRDIIQWAIWHEPIHRRDPKTESQAVQTCFRLLDLTSRSFSTVIQELNPELLLPICLFYLVLRGLDTIEDDMTIDIKEKEPLLREFHKNMEIDGWTYDGNGPNEKDRELLVQFDVVITELKKTKTPYYAVIKDIAAKMGNGMADYALNAEHNEKGVNTIDDYELYCHYVAGLVGEGLTRLFVESKLANPALSKRPELTESMGQFLQKTNIIRDVHEDFLDKRRFWPREIWSKYVDNWEDLFVPENETKALQCSSHMVLNALKHAEECLFYMAAIRDQSVFNFVAIPQAMAIATLELVFQNPAIFRKHVKITRGDACALMTQSTTNLRMVSDIFRRYARRIHHKADPLDPNFLDISIQCGRIESFIESLFPTQDVKKILIQRRSGVASNDTGNTNMPLSELLIFIALVLGMFFLIGGIMIGSAWFLGARFDKVFADLKVGLLGISDKKPSAQGTAQVTHGEL